MKRYIFTVSHVAEAAVQLPIDAETPAAALRSVNATLARHQYRLLGTIDYADDQPPAAWMMRLSGALDETMLSGEDVPPLADDLRRAYRMLDAAGYGYAWSGAGDPEEALARDDTPLFTKPIWTEDESGVNAYLQVRAAYEDDEVGYGFRLEAILYPTGRGELARGEVPFRARFEDKQYFIGTDELPEALAAYEKKFLELINLIRKNNRAENTFDSNQLAGTSAI